MRAELAKRVFARSATCVPFRKGRGSVRAIYNRGGLGARFISLMGARCRLRAVFVTSGDLASMRAELAKRVSARSGSCVPFRKGRGSVRAIYDRGGLGARFFFTKERTSPSVGGICYQQRPRLDARGAR